MDLGVETLIGRKEGAIGWMIFNNPARLNAVSLEMWRAIPRVLAAFEADPEVRVVVFVGAGDRAFVSGADIRGTTQRRRRRGALFGGLGRRQCRHGRRLQADHRHDPRLLHRWRPCRRADL